MAAPFPEMEKSGFGSEGSGFFFFNILHLGYLICPPHGGVKYVIGYSSLEL